MKDNNANNESWKDSPYFWKLKIVPEEYLNSDPSKFKFENLNPHGKIGRFDHFMQMVKRHFPETTYEEICDIIVEDKISHAFSEIDEAAAKRILKKHFGCIYKKLDERPYVTEVDSIDFDTTERYVMLLCSSAYCITYDTQEKKFIGAHLLNKGFGIHGYWIKKK